MVNIRESDTKSDYVELAENSTTSPANTPDLEGHISELEEMHKVAEGDLVELTRPTVIFFHIDKFKLPDFDNAKTDLLEKHQDNGATVPVKTQPSPPNSPLEDASVASAAPLSHPDVEAGNSALQAREGDLPGVCLLGNEYMLYGVYHDWVHKNSGHHLDGGIAEDSKWQAWW